MKRFLAALAAVPLLAGCATPGSRPETQPPSVTPTGSPSVLPLPPGGCSTAGVRLEYGEVNAAMGIRVVGLRLINCGQRPYTVEGYPEVRLLGEAGEPLDVRTVRGVAEIVGPMPNRSGPPQPVVLQPGEAASTAIGWRNTYDDTRKPPVHGTALAVKPQPGRPAEVAALEGGFDLGSTGRLGIEDWQRSP